MNKKVLKGLWWLFFSVNLLMILYIWLNGSVELLATPAGQLIAVGRITGLLGEFCLAMLLLFVGRITFLETCFGHDQLNKWHRNLGFGVTIFLLSHPFFLIAGYSLRDRKSWFNQLMFFLTEWDDVFPALIALAILLLVIIFSVPIIKKLFAYEKWHSVHLLTYVAFILAIGHQMESGDFYKQPLLVVYWYIFNFGCFGLLILYRWLKPLYLFYKHRFQIEKVVNENSDICSVYVKGLNIEQFKFKAGQFANLYILDKKYLWPHPFSFSSDYNGQYLRFTIKSLGDYSKTVNQIKPGTYVIIDGPLGKFTTERAVTKKYLLIAGGVGVTPIVAMAQELKNKQADFAVLYSVKSQQDLIFDNEIKNLTDNYYSFLSCEADEYVEQTCHGGRLDLIKIQKLVPDFKDRDIYICGPAPMMDSVITILKTAGVKKQQIHFERFGY